MEKNEWIRRLCFVVASLVESVALAIPKKEIMLKRVWPHPVDFCIRFRTIPDNPTAPISREISLEHPSMGLASLAQLA